jgi:hypothetical protein
MSTKSIGPKIGVGVLHRGLEGLAPRHPLHGAVGLRHLDLRLVVEERGVHLVEEPAQNGPAAGRAVAVVLALHADVDERQAISYLSCDPERQPLPRGFRPSVQRLARVLRLLSIRLNAVVVGRQGACRLTPDPTLIGLAPQFYPGYFELVLITPFLDHFVEEHLNDDVIAHVLVVEVLFREAALRGPCFPEHQVQCAQDVRLARVVLPDEHAIGTRLEVEHLDRAEILDVDPLDPHRSPCGQRLRLLLHLLEQLLHVRLAPGGR